MREAYGALDCEWDGLWLADTKNNRISYSDDGDGGGLGLKWATPLILLDKSQDVRMPQEARTQMPRLPLSCKLWYDGDNRWLYEVVIDEGGRLGRGMTAQQFSSLRSSDETLWSAIVVMVFDCEAINHLPFGTRMNVIKTIVPRQHHSMSNHWPQVIVLLTICCRCQSGWQRRL